MSSIHNYRDGRTNRWLKPLPAILAMLAATLLLSGCGNSGGGNFFSNWGAQREAPHKSDPLMADPPLDDAARVRNASASVSTYPSGAVLAGPNYRIDLPGYGSNPSMKDWTQAGLSAGSFIASVATLPFQLVMEPPLTPVIYRDGPNYPPSFTVAPPQKP